MVEHPVFRPFKNDHLKQASAILHPDITII